MCNAIEKRAANTCLASDARQCSYNICFTGAKTNENVRDDKNVLYNTCNLCVHFGLKKPYGAYVIFSENKIKIHLLKLNETVGLYQSIKMCFYFSIFIFNICEPLKG